MITAFQTDKPSFSPNKRPTNLVVLLLCYCVC